MPSESVATTSRADRPLTISQIFLRICAVVARLLGEQRRIGRDAVDDAERHERFDFLDVAGVDEELHGILLPLAARASSAPGCELADALDLDRDRSPACSGPMPDGRAGRDDVARAAAS